MPIPLAGKKLCEVACPRGQAASFPNFSAKETKKVSKNLANDEAAEYTITVKDLRFDIPAQRQEGEITYAE